MHTFFSSWDYNLVWLWMHHGTEALCSQPAVYSWKCLAIISCNQRKISLCQELSSSESRKFRVGFVLRRHDLGLWKELVHHVGKYLTSVCWKISQKVATSCCGKNGPFPAGPLPQLYQYYTTLFCVILEFSTLCGNTGAAYPVAGPVLSLGKWTVDSLAGLSSRSCSSWL